MANRKIDFLFAKTLNPHYTIENLLQLEDASKYTITLVTQSS